MNNRKRLLGLLVTLALPVVATGAPTPDDDLGADAAVLLRQLGGEGVEGTKPAGPVSKASATTAPLRADEAKRNEPVVAEPPPLTPAERYARLERTAAKGAGREGERILQRLREGEEGFNALFPERTGH